MFEGIGPTPRESRHFDALANNHDSRLPSHNTLPTIREARHFLQHLSTPAILPVQTPAPTNMPSSLPYQTNILMRIAPDVIPAALLPRFVPRGGSRTQAIPVHL